MTNQVADQAVCFLCSILDEQTKAQRAIVYDSPAATKKVFDVCHALQSRFKRVYVVTMARGRQQGKRQNFAATAKRISDLPVLYGQFSPWPMLTFFISATSLLFLMLRVISQHKRGVLHIIVYNRNWLYVPSLIFARLLNAKCYLDLEDGALIGTAGTRDRFNYVLIKTIFDFLCSHGSILVTPGLKAQVKSTNNVICYGVARCSSSMVASDWHRGAVRFLLGGTLMRETGVLLMMDAVKILNKDFLGYKGALIIVVTGHGSLADDLARFAQAEGKGWIEFHGRVAKAEYEKMLGMTHVGLCLKLPSVEMGTTTFPSKVIEIAAKGKLVITTDLRHVRNLFGAEGAVYLEDENPITLAKAIVSVVSDREAFMRSAEIGQRRVLEICSAEKVADDICKLFEGNIA